LLSAPELSVAHTFTAGRLAARVTSVFLAESLSTPNDSGLGLVRRFSHRHLRNFTRCVYYPNLPLLITICQYPRRIEAQPRQHAGAGLGREVLARLVDHYLSPDPPIHAERIGDQVRQIVVRGRRPEGAHS
jgi:hypothetical protein